MIDVHVLTHSGTRPEWLAQCLASLADEPCTVHVVRGIEGCIAAGRAIGFALGDHPYVTFVDSDDYVLPGSMQAVTDALGTGLDAVVAGEMILADGKLHSPSYGHHLFALRRAVIAPHLDRYARDFAKTHCVSALASIARPTRIDAVTYVWRQHQAQTHRRPL